MNGMRIKRHLITNAAGDVAPACICFAGLTEFEMPQDDMIVLAIEGLCIGGYGVGGSKEVGYVLFTRKKKGMEKKRFFGFKKKYCSLSYQEVQGRAQRC